MARLLVPEEEVRRRMFLPDLDGVRSAITRVLEGITDQLRSELRTPLDEQDGRVDRFYVVDSAQFGGRFAERFLLTQGLVDESVTAVKVELAPRVLSFTPGNTGTGPLDLRDVSEAAVDDPDQFVQVEAERGVLVIHDFRLLHQYVQVTYDAGIAPDPDKPDSLYLQEGARSVPDFLKEMAITWAMLELVSTPQLGIEQQSTVAGKAVRPKVLERKLQGLLDDHVRYEPGAKKPIR